MAMCTKALLGDPIMYNFDARASPHPSAIDSINDVINTHKKYWKNLCFQIALPKENVLPSPAPSRGLTLDKSSKSEDVADQDVFYDCCDNIKEDTSVDSTTGNSFDIESSLNNNLDSSSPRLSSTNELEMANNNILIDAATIDNQNIPAGSSSSNVLTLSLELESPKNVSTKQTLSQYLSQNLDVSAPIIFKYKNLCAL